MKKFKEVWPYVDSVYSMRSGKRVQQNGTVEVRHGECRLVKSRKSRLQPQNREVNRRHASTRDKNLCQVKIRISWCSELGSVTVERVGDAVHLHNIEDSFAAKIPTHLQRVIDGEAVKGYSAAQIYHALRGTTSSANSSRLDIVGGATLTMYVIKSS